MPLAEALGKLLAMQSNEITKILADYHAPELAAHESGIPKSWGATPNLLRVYFVLCKVLRPQIVVETGVATGVATALLLRELAAINGARLISVELPILGRSDLSYIGSSVPHHLRSRWTLVVDPSVLALRKMRDLAGKVDIFVHDSDLSYHNRLREYRIAMEMLAPGGVMVANDVKNDAFLEVCGAAATVPVIVPDREDRSYICLTRAPQSPRREPIA